MTQSKQMALAAADAAITKGALQPVLFDVTNAAAYTDFILLLSVKNPRQSEAVMDMVHDRLKASGRDPIGMEGEGEAQWRLLDYGEIVVHVFHHSARLYYDLEGLWSEAPRIELEVPAGQAIVNPLDYEYDYACS